MVFHPTTFVLPVKLSKIGDFQTGKLRSTTIGELKKLLETKWERPVKEVLLRGRPLKDHYSLGHYDIDKETLLGVDFQSSLGRFKEL